MSNIMKPLAASDIDFGWIYGYNVKLFNVNFSFSFHFQSRYFTNRCPVEMLRGYRPSLVWSSKRWRLQVSAPWKQSAVDIVLSSSGWVAITIGTGQTVTFLAYTPLGKGVFVQSPPLFLATGNSRG